MTIYVFAGVVTSWRTCCISMPRVSSTVAGRNHFQPTYKDDIQSRVHLVITFFFFRDFADIMKIPRCSACDELIFAAEYTGQIKSIQLTSYLLVIYSLYPPLQHSFTHHHSSSAEKLFTVIVDDLRSVTAVVFSQKMTSSMPYLPCTVYTVYSDGYMQYRDNADHSILHFQQ